MSAAADDNNEVDEIPITDDAHKLLAEANNSTLAKRKEVATSFRKFLSTDTTQLKLYKLTTEKQLEAFIPACCKEDDVLFRFALVRSYDFPSASKRFMKFCNVLNSVGLTDISTLTDDTRAVFRTGVYHILSKPDKHGRPVMNMYMTTFSWDKLTIKQMQHATIWAMWRTLSMQGFAGQTIGCSFAMFLEGMSMGQIKLEFETFCTKLWQEMLPLKVGAFFLADDPFVFRNVLWPMAKSGFKKKLRERVYWLNSSPDPKNGKPKKYHQLHVDYHPEMIPSTHGGTLNFDATKSIAEMEACIKAEREAVEKQQAAEAEKKEAEAVAEAVAKPASDEEEKEKPSKDADGEAQ